MSVILSAAHFQTTVSLVYNSCMVVARYWRFPSVHNIAFKFKEIYRKWLSIILNEIKGKCLNSFCNSGKCFYCAFMLTQQPECSMHTYTHTQKRKTHTHTQNGGSGRKVVMILGAHITHKNSRRIILVKSSGILQGRVQSNILSETQNPYPPPGWWSIWIKKIKCLTAVWNLFPFLP